MKAGLKGATPLPLYSQIREQLRARILDGTYRAHAQLPTEGELTATYSVSRITVRQALNDLQKEGLIYKVHGKGTFVAKPKAFQELARLQGFGEAMHRHGHETYNRLIGLRHVAPSKRVAEALKCARAVEVTELKRVRFLNREPISLDITYVPRAIGERLAREDLATRDVFLILENDYGLPLGHAELRIDATTADDAIARQLGTVEGAPILRIERLTHTTSGEPIDFEYLYYRGDAFQYRLRVERVPIDLPSRKGPDRDSEHA
jgi:GntR family transcriptional regulator